MAKTVLVQCYEGGGDYYSFRMKMCDWQEAADTLGKMLGNELDAKTFYVVWTNLKRRWDGAKRRELYSTLCHAEFRVVWQDVERGCHCHVVPSLVPRD